jgi:hypothetical protein
MWQTDQLHTRRAAACRSVLFLLFLGMLGLLYLEGRAALPPVGHEIAQLVIAVLFCGLTLSALPALFNEVGHVGNDDIRSRQ